MRLLSTIMLMLFVGSVQANFNISPLSQTISTKQKSASYTLENLTDRKAAYVVKVATRTINSMGEELREETKEIRVFPSKIILEPQQKKRIKVIYLGKRNIEQEKAFRVVFMQLDRDVTESEKSELNAKFNFHTAFYVTPKNAEARLNANLTQGNEGPQLALANRGNKHIILQDWKLKLTSGEQSVIYDQPLPDINMLANSKVFIPLSSKANSYDLAEIVTH
ncbi:fimbria/pilus periplasmic chaperone [Vibrio sp. 404]|uniref:Fimbria/pilus periplasmic chaperone n=1 Tax=Vibrio marinisediminis TaxID=2758441 RepID=A0A7W2FMH3_9VIBR|nr:fimbria/pilus periplasmic chaperone [Vibrio marinisediminis]MBA5760813.1 fimbria/pilus periplasmic chaperone [Vibrio marinisediminis]